MKAAEFQGRTVYIVGGSTGIGLAAAKRIAGLGAHVVVFARRRELLEEAVASVRSQVPQPAQRVAYRQLDAADPQQVRQVMEESVHAVGLPDVLINCAGRAAPDYFERISYEQFTETLRLNLHSCWNTARALVPHMKRAGGGYIVNTASLAGLIGVFGYTDYCAAKFAVVGFSEALRSELRPYNISVSVLCPPDTDTPGFAQENTTKPPETRAVSSGARVLSAEAVADALLVGMARRRPIIVPGWDGRLAVLAKRVWPGLVEHVADTQVRRVRAGRRSVPRTGSRGP
jgi:3-dehydrosphinganine reductase